MEEQDRSRSPSRRTSRVEQVVGRWLRRSRDLGSRSHSLSRDRVGAEGKTAETSSPDQRNYPFRFTVQISHDPSLNSHGLSLSPETPILVQEVTPGGPADGRLVPGDQLVKINNVTVEDLTPEQAAEIIRECQDTVTMTVLRTMLGPKSSFITPEKRAKLKSNPVKVHFTEEVEVNGHSQGNSLLFLPNVLKVYLENGQTKAFKFEPNTTVKDIVMTLKEKLSLSRIEHFSLVLEQQYSVTKLLLLHEDEKIQQVVQKREVHDYRCLFRVCFIPKEPQELLMNDPTAFEYFYLQGVNDVLQERFAVEMRCNTALRLAALHIQERLTSCGQSSKTNLKTITKTWGIENFVSSTLLRNMREKDLRKAISYHMKKCQSQQDPKQKVPSASQARINYLEELSDLKSFGGKSFSATMMLQDRESMVTLLVGARYGVSQVVNHKLSITTILTEFKCITRIELLPESDKVSLVKIYLQDIKPITLLLESVSAKDMSCLIAGYCRVIDPNLNIFPWADDSKKHRISAEEGYVSRCDSDSDASSDMETDARVAVVSHDVKPRPRIRSSSDPAGRKRKDREKGRDKGGREKLGEKPWGDSKETEEKDVDTEKEKWPPSEKRKVDEEGGPDSRQTRVDVTVIDLVEEDKCNDSGKEGGEEPPSVSEASDSCCTDSRFLTSQSSDSLDALEEDDLIACSSSIHPHPNCQLHPYVQTHPYPHLLSLPPAHAHPFINLITDPPGEGVGGTRRSGDGADPHLSLSISNNIAHDQTESPSIDPCSDDNFLCFSELTRLVDYLPSPPEASEEDDDEEEELRKRRMLHELDELARRAFEGGGEVFGGCTQHLLSPSSPSSQVNLVFNFDQSDARCYYKLCSNVTPDSARTPARPPLHRVGGEKKEQDKEGVEGDGATVVDLEPIPILQPPPGFGDSSSDEEFFDARDRFVSPEDPTSGSVPRGYSKERKTNIRTLSLGDIRISVAGVDDYKKEMGKQKGEEEGVGRRTVFQLRRRSRKRRSFVETDFTSTVSFPEPDPNQDLDSIHKNLQAHGNDDQMLSSGPEPSSQTQNPCRTVSSLSHSEGEPSQLESKPIPLEARSPGSSWSPDPDREPQATSRARKQEMEMEPDAMESKSLTDLVKKASITSITVVRCRVEPDGKESADRRGDGKEGGEVDTEIGKETGKGEIEVKEELTRVSRNGSFVNNMLLEIIEDKDKCGEPGQEGENREDEELGDSPSSERPLIGSITQPEGNPSASQIPTNFCSTTEQNLCRMSIVDKRVGNHLKSPSYALPPSPPTSPLPPLPKICKSLNNHLAGTENMETSVQISFNMTEDNCKVHNPELLSNKLCTSYTNLQQIGAGVKYNANEDEASSVASSATTISDEVIDSTNSDNVFDNDDDDEGSNSLNCGFSESRGADSNKYNASKRISGNIDSEGKAEAPTNTQLIRYNPSMNSNNASRHIVNSPEPGTAQGFTLKTDFPVNKEMTTKNALCTNEVTDKSRRESIITSATACSGISPAKVNEAIDKGAIATSNHSLAKANMATIHDLSKELPSPTHFLFQNCSHSIMGRLSASTLRGKIQRLPLYLSHSQETLNQVGVGNVAQSKDDTEIIIKITDVNNITKTMDFEIAAEAIESDDSDDTVTGSETESEFVVELSSAEITRTTVLEVREEVERVVMVNESSTPPVQTEPRPEPRMQRLSPGFNGDTPGPIVDSPGCIFVGLDRRKNSSGTNMDTPGPTREARESGRKIPSLSIDTSKMDINMQSPSVPPPIVVTTQNLNGPGFSLNSRSEKIRKTSSDRPLVGLCQPAEDNAGTLEALSSGCGVFTVCKDQSQTKNPTQLGYNATLKPEFGCSSLLASGCESLVEGVQMPLDACGCPDVYPDCFSGRGSFDDELTVYEFSCRTQSSEVTHTSGAGLPLMTTPHVPSFLSTSPLSFSSSALSPSFPRSVLFSSSASEISPLLSPLSDASDCFLSQMHKDAISRLRRQRYPPPPAGFQALRGDVDQLLSILEGGGAGRSVGGCGGRHPRDTCPAHFTENKRVLHMEACQLMAGCQKVVGAGQSSDEMLLFLADGFRTLVELAGICLWFSSCDRCDQRNAEAVTGLADVARSFRDFCLAAERASGKRSCQDLSTKLLAKQCTALTASVFCLTQLFRTLTAL